MYLIHDKIPTTDSLSDTAELSMLPLTLHIKKVISYYFFDYTDYSYFVKC